MQERQFEGYLFSCVFCNIVNGSEKCYPLFEDDNIKAFLPLYPVSVCPTLIIPKKHYETIFDISVEELSHVTEMAKKFCLLYRKKIGTDRVTLLVSNGKATSQKIMHFHLHIIPRKENDRLHLLTKDDHLKNPDLEQIYKNLKPIFGSGGLLACD